MLMIKSIQKKEKYTDMVPVKKERLVTVMHTFCDLCSKKMIDEEENIYDEDDTSYIDGFDICYRCFEKKVTPWLESQKKKSSNANEDN